MPPGLSPPEVAVDRLIRVPLGRTNPNQNTRGVAEQRFFDFAWMHRMARDVVDPIAAPVQLTDQRQAATP